MAHNSDGEYQFPPGQGGGGIPDAPMDGQQYARRSGAWETVSGGGSANTVRNGTGAPSVGVGDNGDFYIDTLNNDIYGPKALGVWGVGTSLVGPQGIQGLIGLTGPAGADGAQGIQGDTGATGAQGPQGIQGDTGPQGATGPAGADGATGSAGADGQGLPTGGTAGQVLEKIDGTDYNTQWATPAGGGSSVYALWKAKGNLASASFDDTENALSWNAFAINPNSDVSLSGSVITINTTGTYKFTVTLRTDNSNRTELFVRTYINTGGGLTQDTDEIVSDYVSRDGDQDTGAVTLVTALALSATNTVEFRGFGDTDGTSIGLDAGTILLIERAA